MAKLSDLPRIVKNLLEREVILEEGAKAIRRALPKRIRSGRGVMENLEPTHFLPKLAGSTVNIRKGLKKKGQLTGKGAVPGKSGFNRTGDSVDNLKVTVSRKLINVELGPLDQHKLQDSLLINGRYQFMRLSANEFKRVLKAMTKRIEQTLQKVNITDL